MMDEVNPNDFRIGFTFGIFSNFAAHTPKKLQEDIAII